MPVSEGEFRDALSRFASGVSVVTTLGADGVPHGITVSAFCSVSLYPPLVLICIEKVTASHDSFIDSGVYVVNVLDESQMWLSERFAAPSEDKFGDIDVYPGIGGVPVLADALANIECRITERIDGGDHSIFIGSVERSKERAGSPLIYFRGDYNALKINNHNG
ncbi:MAG: flavin reductase family protein [Pyrinomonadaceae bacterium]